MARVKDIARIVLSRPRPVRFLLARLLAKTGLSRRLTIRRRGYRLHFFPTSLSSALWEGGPGERLEEEQLIRDLLRPGDTYVDVGANIGALAIVARQAVGPEGRVVAVEAHPKVFGYMRENLRLNTLSAETHNCAVGEEEGELVFSDIGQDDQNAVVPAGGEGLSVPVRRLDSLLAGVGPVRLLKVDVEGFELPVFRGGGEVLARTELILFECWERHTARYGYEPADVLRLLTAAGFGIHTESGDPVDLASRFPTCVNLVAIGPACADAGRVLALLR